MPKIELGSMSRAVNGGFILRNRVENDAIVKS
jgi:hypothetical protein